MYMIFNQLFISYCKFRRNSAGASARPRRKARTVSASARRRARTVSASAKPPRRYRSCRSDQPGTNFLKLRYEHSGFQEIIVVSPGDHDRPLVDVGLTTLAYRILLVRSIELLFPSRDSAAAAAARARRWAVVRTPRRRTSSRRR